ncbi:MAG: NAD(P)-dependent alcohol dehydrogenase [Chloroflexi bacterium]|nr:NAD(P)-dependent alcohol dehydrogenase [Chloroflexota bacterium]
MRAMVYRRYGSPDELRLEQVPMPVIGDDGVLVRVRAVSLNALDWHLLRGAPYIARATAGLRRPKRTVPGVDVAGVVEAVGSRVTALRPGDEVWGEKSRACAEYVGGPERLWVAKPSSLSFEQAAALPAAGVTALQALRDKGGVRPGTRVLVHGAGGGVGTFAVQIAKADGAIVTATTSTAKVDLVSSLGADRVIDYTRDDVTAGSDEFDLILDIGADRPLRTMRRVLADEGTLVVVGAPEGRWIAPIVRLVAARLLSRGGQRLIGHLTETRREDLLAMNELVESGKVRPVIDRCYPLAETPDALRYLETLQAAGKVVITIP